MPIPFGSVLNDREIGLLCSKLGTAPDRGPMIAPFVSEQVREDRYPYGDKKAVISYGVSSFGYDIRLADEDFRIYSSIYYPEIDPKSFDDRCLLSATLQKGDSGSYWLLPAHHYGLGLSYEEFDLPASVLGVCFTKSTYARCGIIVNTTPLEPEWRGRLVLEICNPTPVPVRIYANEGISQLVFFHSNNSPATTYATRNGKYQDQQSIVTART